MGKLFDLIASIGSSLAEEPPIPQHDARPSLTGGYSKALAQAPTAFNDTLSMAGNWTPEYSPTTTEPMRQFQSAATASRTWLAARDRHINHLMACRACYAPTGRYCPTGSALRTAYDETNWS